MHNSYVSKKMTVLVHFKPNKMVFPYNHVLFQLIGNKISIACKFSDKISQIVNISEVYHISVTCENI